MNPCPVVLLVFSALAVNPGCRKESAQKAPEDPGAAKASPKLVLRVGHFPNITHAQALVAHRLSRKGKGWFEQRLGPGAEIEWFVYNAGPSAMEAVFADAIDLTYVGPSPTINAYMKSRGEEARIIAGAAVGGAALVVQSDGRIKVAADFRGKKVATPQLGNTQDVACRAWLVANGFKITQQGGDVDVMPTANPDQLSLFQRKAIDAVWTVEPWVSRLELEAKGTLLVEERDTITTVLVSSAKFLKERKELARKFAEAHAELTEWIKANPDEAQGLAAGELQVETTRPMAADLLTRSWKRLTFTSQITLLPLEKFVAQARSVGFLRDTVDLSRLVEALR
jgi:NitT/TauT family transport system substrate-binding protein